jgi:ferredoxin
MTNLGLLAQPAAGVLGAMGIREVRRLRGGTAARCSTRTRAQTFQALFAGQKVEHGSMSDIKQVVTAKITRKGQDPTRFRNAIGKYKVIRTDRCIGCGKCASSAPRRARALQGLQPHGAPEGPPLPRLTAARTATTTASTSARPAR